MRRRLILLRHGHAEEADSDYDRPLSSAGITQARHAAAELARAGWIPDLILTSSAPRAHSTADIVAASCGARGAIRSERSLYLAAEGRILSTLQGLGRRLATVLLVGHNPGLSALARELCGPTGELATGQHVSVELDLDDWSELG